MTTSSIRYIGAEPLREEPITGSKRVWDYGQIQTVDTAIATQLLTTELFEDDAGGAPNASAIDLRHRMYGASGVFQTTGDLADLSLTPSSAIDVRMLTPMVASAMASASVADVGLSQGYALDLFVTSPATSPVRVRIYSPQLRRVA